MLGKRLATALLLCFEIFWVRVHQLRQLSSYQSQLHCSRKMAEQEGAKEPEAAGRARLASSGVFAIGSKSLLTFLVLGLAWFLGFSSRLFSVLRFESIIHEFDPW